VATDTVPIAGSVDPRFASLRDAFRANFAEEEEIGATLCVRVGGQTVADLWGGWRDEARTRPWQRDTLVNVYSVGKGVSTVLALVLAERGLLDLDALVVDTWPEFGTHGKEVLRVCDLLSHRAGLPAPRESLGRGAFRSWSRLTETLAAQVPWWAPGEHHGYHVNTWGFLIGEVICRLTGLRFGEALARNVTGPLQADFHVGLPEALHARCAEVVAKNASSLNRQSAAEAFPPTGDPVQDEMIQKTYFNPPELSGTGVVNTAAWRSAEVPSTNGHGNARSVCAVYGALLAGLVSDALLTRASAIASDGVDRVLGRHSRFGLGFQLAMPERPMGRSSRAFGHFGYGGTLGFADPDAGIAFAYVMNRPGVRWQTPRVGRLVDALYDALSPGVS